MPSSTRMSIVVCDYRKFLITPIKRYDDGQSDSPSSASGASNTPAATDTSTSVASSSGTNIGSIVGPAVAVPLAVMLGIVAFFLLRRRKGRAKPEEDAVDGFVVHGWNPGHMASASTAQSRQPLMDPHPHDNAIPFGSCSYDNERPCRVLYCS